VRILLQTIAVRALRMDDATSRSEHRAGAIESCPAVGIEIGE
jgi:hypothetical protein